GTVAPGRRRAVGNAAGNPRLEVSPRSLHAAGFRCRADRGRRRGREIVPGSVAATPRRGRAGRTARDASVPRGAAEATPRDSDRWRLRQNRFGSAQTSPSPTEHGTAAGTTDYGTLKPRINCLRWSGDVGGIGDRSKRLAATGYDALAAGASAKTRSY